MARPKKASNGSVLPDDKFKQREALFAIYRDMRTARSLHRLETELRQNHPKLAVSRSSLMKWSTTDDWAKRCKAHNDTIANGWTTGAIVNASADAKRRVQPDRCAAAANQR
jgi:hypothetical protein